MAKDAREESCKEEKTCADDAAQDPGSAARETALQGVQSGIRVTDPKLLALQPPSACIITGVGGGVRLMMVTTSNRRSTMINGGQVTSGYCFANLNHISRSDLIDCFVSMVVGSMSWNITAGQRESKCGATSVV